MTAETIPTSPRLPAPLAGIRVLDLTVALAGPFCGLILAGLGAEVLKIESPDGGDIARGNPPFYGPNGFHVGSMLDGDISVATLARARNKRSVTLNLKSEEGRALFMQLVKKSDLVIENMSDGTADRLGVGYEAVCAVNPKIIYGSVLGLGDPSPYPGMKAMDIIVQALGGTMAVTGEPGGAPMRFGIPIADLLAPLFASSGLLAALIQRGVTGVGQHVKVSMLDCLASLLAVEHFDVFERAGFGIRSGNSHDRLCPFGVYQANDGYVAIAAPPDALVRRIADAMSQPEIMDDPRFSTRGPRAANADDFNRLLEDWTRRHSCAELEAELFDKRGVSCVPVRSVEEVLQDPKLRASGAVQELVHPRLGMIDAVGPGLPIKFSRSHSGYDRPAEELAAGNPYVYRELLGLDEAAIRSLKENGVI